MKGPLDALIESETLAAAGFDDPTARLHLYPAAAKKFKLRRFLKNLFQQQRVAGCADQGRGPEKVKLVLISWGVAVVAVIGALTAFWVFSPGTATELLQKAEETGGKKQITNSIGIKLVLIPAGEFKMGSGESAEDAAAFFNKVHGSDALKADFFKDEYPQHRVRVTRPFYLGAYHVTRGQFRQFVADTGYKTEAEKDGRGAYGYTPEDTWEQKPEYTWRSPGFFADGRAPRGQRKLERRDRIL